MVAFLDTQDRSKSVEIRRFFAISGPDLRLASRYITANRCQPASRHRSSANLHKSASFASTRICQGHLLRPRPASQKGKEMNEQRTPVNTFFIFHPTHQGDPKFNKHRNPANTSLKLQSTDRDTATPRSRKCRTTRPKPYRSLGFPFNLLLLTQLILQRSHISLA